MFKWFWTTFLLGAPVYDPCTLAWQPINLKGQQNNNLSMSLFQLFINRAMTWTSHLWPVTCILISGHLALGSSVHGIKIYSVDNAIGFPNLFSQSVDNIIQRLNNRGLSNFMFHLNFYQISWISLCTDVPSSLRKKSSPLPIFSWGRRGRLYTGYPKFTSWFKA